MLIPRQPRAHFAAVPTLSVPAPPGTRRIEQIDVLRGLAALWVVLSHYQPYWNLYIGPTPIIVPNAAGLHAVELFFIISGFVIFMTLERCRTLLDFIVLRGSRLYPAYWTALLLGAALNVFVWQESLWPRGLLVNLTMFEEFVGVPRADNVFWSLTVELAFYLNVAWVFALGAHRYPRVLVGIWLLATSVWALAGGQADLDHEHRLWPALLFAFDYAPYFATGIIFFDVTQRGWSRAGAALLLFAALVEWLIGGWVAVLIAAFVASLVWLAVRGYLWFLVSRATLGLGAISYSLYVIHRNLGYKALDWLHAHDVGAAVAMPLVIGGMILVAMIMTYGIERPALTMIRHWHRSRALARDPGVLRPA